MLEQELDQRKEKILAKIIEHYIATGEPVGSKLISDSKEFNISPATIRNEMAVLSQLGYLEQPHTSSGRVPSHKAYRLYINKLMDKKPVTKEDRKAIETNLNVEGGDPERLIQSAGQLLAELTNCAALSTTPQTNECRISQVELMPVGKRTFLLIIVTSSGIVRNKICRFDFDISIEALQFFVDFANKYINRVAIKDVSLAFIQTLATATGEYMMELSPLLNQVYELVRDIDKMQINLEGQSNLLNHKELDTSAKDLLKILARPEELSQIVSENSLTTSVVLGTQLNSLAFCDTSLIFTKYFVGGQVAGAIGIIGPLRNDYAKLIPKLEYFAQVLGELLEESFDDEI